MTLILTLFVGVEDAIVPETNSERTTGGDASGRNFVPTQQTSPSKHQQRPPTSTDFHLTFAPNLAGSNHRPCIMARCRFTPIIGGHVGDP